MASRTAGVMEATKTAKAGVDQPTDLVSWFDQWVKSRSNKVTPERQVADTSRFHTYIEPRWGRTRIDRIKSKDVQRWIEDATWTSKTRSGGTEAREVGPATRYATVMVLRQILDLAVERGVVRSNPAANARTEAAPTGIKLQAEDDVLTPEQSNQIIAKMDSHYQSLALLGLRLGITWAEAMGLRTEDVDFDNRRLTIGRWLGIETGGRVVPREGDPAEVRSVSIPSDVFSALAGYVMATRSLREATGDDWLFLTPNGKRPLRPNWNRYVLRPALREAGLPETGAHAPTFHTFRHTAARDMLQNGVSLEEVSRVLGHRSVNTTRRYYKAFIPDAE